MKVAFDVSQTCVNRQGCGWHADSLAHALASLAPKCELILYHQFGDWMNPFTVGGTRLPGCQSPFADLTREEAETLWRAIENGSQPLPGDPDVVHSNSFMAPRIGSIPLVYTLHDLCFWTHPEFTEERNRLLCQTQVLRALENAAGFHFISDTTRQDFEKLFPGWLEEAETPWITAHSGPRILPRKGHDKQSPLPDAPWLYIGAIEPRKNVGSLLDAYEAYCERTAAPRPLKIAGGPGWKSESVHQRIRSFSARLPIEYLGYIPDDRLASLYEEAFAYLCPSHYEGFGLPVIEAMAFGLPVLSNHVPSVREIAGEAALFEDFSNPLRVAEQMKALEAHPERYAHHSLWSLLTAERFNWRQTAEALLDFYELVLRKTSVLAR